MPFCLAIAERAERSVAGRAGASWLAAGLLAAALLGAAAVGHAAQGTSGTLHRSVGSGLTLTVDTTWIDGGGYRPVRVTLTPTGPVPADRTITVELLVRQDWSHAGHDLRVVEHVEIPAGSAAQAPIQATLSAAQSGRWTAYAINVFEDGKLLPTLCTPWTSGNNFWEERLPAILFVGADVPNTSGLAAGLHEGMQQNLYEYRGGSSMQDFELPTVASCPSEELPTRWIDYTSLDIVCLSLDQLAGLKQSRPEALRALADWTEAGGNLWVFGAGVDFERIGQIDALLGLPPADGWTPPDPRLFGQPVRNVPDYRADTLIDPRTGLVVDQVEATVEGSEARPLVPPKKPPFQCRTFGLGLVVALAADNPFPGNRAAWNWLFGTMEEPRWSWLQRHGMSALNNNPGFWNFLIPGVGLAPVWEFCGLITLFVLAIGPLNFWLLRRRKRVHLLVVTIPLGAAAVTAALFAYAVLADGLATRVRIRSATLLDQRRGRAVCWSRTCYYAGLAPSGGLVFSADTAVWPLEFAPKRSGNSPLNRQIIWEEDRQRLAAGWLPARTPTQFLALRARASRRGLDLLAGGNSNDPPKVKNRLGTRIEQLAVCAPDGTTYWAAEVAADAAAPLVPIEPADLAARLRKTHLANRPAFPPGMEEPSYGVFGLSRGRRYYGYYGGNTPEYLVAGSRMERQLDTLGSGGSPPLRPGSYLAVVERSPEVEIGIPAAREEAGYHVIFGTW